MRVVYPLLLSMLALSAPRANRNWNWRWPRRGRAQSDRLFASRRARAWFGRGHRHRVRRDDLPRIAPSAAGGGRASGPKVVSALACRSESDLLKASLPLVPSESVSINFEKIAPARGCMGSNAQAALRGADLELVPFVVARTAWT